MIQNTMARKMTKNRTVNMSDITGGVSSESQPEPVTAAEGCDHVVGYVWNRDDGVELVYACEMPRKLNGRFSFCPDCGKELNHDALFPPSTQP